MVTHEAWLTALFNTYLAGLGNWLLALFHQMATNPNEPWADHIVMQILVAAIIVVLLLVVRAGLSVDKPGALQHVFELIHSFIGGEAEDQIGHDGRHHIVLFETLFVFLLICNLIGIIPKFVSPTQVIYVPAGCAVLAFLYYNWVGVQKNGIGKYATHFAGPIWWMAPLMIPDRNHQPPGAAAFAHHPSFRQHVCGRAGDAGVSEPDLSGRARHFPGTARVRGLLQAYIFVLLTMMYVAGAVAEEH